jgi:hypothetical protein
MTRGDKAMVAVITVMFSSGIALVLFGMWVDGRHAR